MFDIYWFLNLYDFSGGSKSACAMFDTLTCTRVQRSEVVHMDNSAAKNVHVTPLENSNPWQCVNMWLLILFLKYI